MPLRKSLNHFVNKVFATIFKSFQQIRTLLYFFVVCHVNIHTRTEEGLQASRSGAPNLAQTPTNLTSFPCLPVQFKSKVYYSASEDEYSLSVKPFKIFKTTYDINTAFIIKASPFEQLIDVAT